MRERFHPAIRSIPALAVICAAPLAMTGCAGKSSARIDGTSSRDSNDIRLNAETRREQELRALAESEQPSNSYAAQAERDIADWLAMGEVDAGTSSSMSSSSEVRAAPPAVRFNEPGGVRSRGAERPKSLNAPVLELPRTMPGFNAPVDGEASSGGQKPLFRDENPAVDVDDPQGAGAPSDARDSGSTAKPRSTDVLLVDLRRALLRQSIESNQPLRELIAIAMTTYMDPNLALQPEAFRELTEEERVLLEKLQQFFSALHTKLDGSIPSDEAITSAVLELEKALIQQPELAIPTATICWRVGGFGDYDTFDRMAFLAQSQQRIILYLEIDGFTSEQNKRSEWVTEVSQQLEIISDRDGIPVWTEPWQKATDVTSNRRRDFFTTQIITLPKALSVGKYNLKIRARDEKSGAIAERTIDFEMVADEQLTGKMNK